MDNTRKARRWGVLLLVILTAVPCAPVTACDPDDIEELRDSVSRLEELVGTISRQLMMQQFYVEEQTRANGNSGIKQMRTGRAGTKPYYSASHVDTMLASMHDHANTIRTIGLGELIAVLNGIEFRTRHNDYELVRKSTTSSEYGATEEIPFPDVPQEVLQFVNVDDQVAEMREWFRAWRDQDYSVRDYRQYFKPVLCYMEGMWTHSDQHTIEESFDSSRHHLDAKSWLDLQDKIRFTSYSGTKDSLENYAYLPTTIFTIENGTTPIFVQWNFRILCHPISRDIPLKRMNVVDDLKTRMAHDLTFEEYASSRTARFQVGVNDRDQWADKRSDYGLLDELMEEIAGADNYMGYIEDDLLGTSVHPVDTNARAKMNVARYHRAYRVVKKGALGLKIRHRGFSDENLFLAQTTNPKVAGLSVEQCEESTCEKWFQRWSYAIPLEIIYLTPLSRWNPYNIIYKGVNNQREGRSIHDGPNGRRNGENSYDKAYNGTNSKVYYRTPYDFFENAAYSDPADTTEDYTHVLDSGGNIRQTRASGSRIFIPNIPGVGTLRQRYPIMPIHGEGSALWKEVAALRDTIMRPSKHAYMFRHEMPLTGSPDEACLKPKDICERNSRPYEPSIEFAFNPPPETQAREAINPNLQNSGKMHFRLDASVAEFGSHSHLFELSEDEAQLYRAGEAVTVTTEEAYAHSHQLEIQLVERGDGRLVDWARRCDGELFCWDGHARKLVRVIE